MIKTLNEIRIQGFDIFVKNPGPADAIRFIQSYSHGSGDYTKERKGWLERDFDTVVAGIISHRERKVPGQGAWVLVKNRSPVVIGEVRLRRYHMFHPGTPRGREDTPAVPGNPWHHPDGVASRRSVRDGGRSFTHTITGGISLDRTRSGASIRHLFPEYFHFSSGCRADLTLNVRTLFPFHLFWLHILPVHI